MSSGTKEPEIGPSNMRSKQEIVDRLRDLIFAELQRRVALAEKRLPMGCVHNHQQPLDVRRRVAGDVNDCFNRIAAAPAEATTQRIGLCMYGSEKIDTWAGDICEDPIDAQRCPLFTPKQSKEQILKEFRDQLLNLAWVEENLPHIHALVWVLGSSRYLGVSWFTWTRRLWWYFRRIEIEPQHVPEDYTKLLEHCTFGSDEDQP